MSQLIYMNILRKVCIPLPCYLSLILITPSISFHQSQFENRRGRKRDCPRSSHLLSQRKKSKKNQLPSMVLQCFRCYPPTQRLRSLGCWYYARPDEYLSFMESFRYQFECWGCLWRDCGFKREIWTEPYQSFGCCTEFRV